MKNDQLKAKAFDILMGELVGNERFIGHESRFVPKENQSRMVPVYGWHIRMEDSYNIQKCLLDQASRELAEAGIVFKEMTTYELNTSMDKDSLIQMILLNKNRGSVAIDERIYRKIFKSWNKFLMDIGNPTVTPEWRENKNYLILTWDT